MRPRFRRIVVAFLSVATIAVAAAAVRQTPPTRHTFLVTLGLNDASPTDWSGDVSVSGGEVLSVRGWRFEEKDVVNGAASWKCRTRLHVADRWRYPVAPAHDKPNPPPERPWPNGVFFTIAGESALVELRLAAGGVKFAANDVLLGEPRSFLGGRVRVERLAETEVLRLAASPKQASPVQDDYPAFWVRYRTGKHYLAWVAYQKEKDRVLFVERDGPHGRWSEARVVADSGDHFRVALASTHDDTLWIVWSEQRQKKWGLFGRPYKDGQLGKEIQVADSEGPNIWHRMTTDSRGRAWVVWQQFHGGQSDIIARCADADGWHEPVKVSEPVPVATGPVNEWDPAIAADPKSDRVWVGWDTFETGNYSVHMRSISEGPKAELGPELAPEMSSNRCAHVSLACDRAGRLWAAWDESGPQWGKDAGYLYQDTPATKLYASRWIRVKCFADGKWLEPAAEFARSLPADMQEFNELPQLQDDAEGRVWLAFRHRTCRRPRSDGWAIQARWDVVVTAFLGDHWLPPILLDHSGGRNDMRVSSQRDREGNVYFAHASDNRTWMPAPMAARNLSVAVSQLSSAARPREAKLVPRNAPLPPPVVVHPREVEQVRRVRGYKIEMGGRTYRIYRGDLHRHTDISNDGVGDGSLMDLHRYALDAAALDFIMVTDHNMGNDNEYSWWRTQKANDLYTVPGRFISLYGYERSVQYPNGHRNVIWEKRGHRTLPLPKQAVPAQMAADTGKLYAYLRRTEGICTLHTSATGQGTNWQEPIDGELEPVVELFQGYHGSYEAPGAPRLVDANSDIIHSSFKQDGYVSLALDKGYRLGFQASSDHIATHVSYACVLAEEFSRKGLMNAIRKRHTYAATDNIVLDVRAGTRGIMGDEIRTTKPELDIVVLGTGPIDRVEVLRNSHVVHAERPAGDADEVRFRWADREPVNGDKPSYYYVRVTQKNNQMAWSSPIWVRVGD